MSIIQRVREEFSGFAFGAPCSAEDLLRAERQLGESLPALLRELYLAFDGFQGPTGAQFFWPLFGKGGLVEFNGFLRDGDEFPHTFICSCIFFGDAGIGDMWGVKHDLPDKIIRWDATWGEDFTVVGDSPLAVWVSEKQSYDALDTGHRAQPDDEANDRGGRRLS